MCDHIILSAVKRSLFDSLRSHRVNSTKSKNPMAIEDHPLACLDCAREDKQIAVAEQNPKLYILTRHNEI
jgi:hypothetical protein